MASAARAEPWLGTLVHIRACHSDSQWLSAAISDAFAAVARIHRLMSVHDPDSELSRVNRLAHKQRLALSIETHAVLSFALELAQFSQGMFDPCVGAALTRQGLLPAHVWPEPGVRSGAWQDIDLDEHSVSFKRSLSLDFGGIAKGYAVDQALAVLHQAGCESALVNAGGDLARFGHEPELIHIRAPVGAYLPALSLRQGAVATSHYGDACAHQAQDMPRSVLIDPRQDQAILSMRCASVCASRCLHADALTKLVMLQADGASDVLRHYHATALLIQPLQGQLYTTYLPAEQVTAAPAQHITLPAHHRER